MSSDTAEMDGLIDRAVQTGKELVLERMRQISAKRFLPERDDAYRDGELARAAAGYALVSVGWSGGHGTLVRDRIYPWESMTTDIASRDMLVRAGALIIAEIERLDRAAGK